MLLCRNSAFTAQQTTEIQSVNNQEENTGNGSRFYSIPELPDQSALTTSVTLFSKS